MAQSANFLASLLTFFAYPLSPFFWLAFCCVYFLVCVLDIHNEPCYCTGYRAIMKSTEFLMAIVFLFFLFSWYLHRHIRMSLLVFLLLFLCIYFLDCVNSTTATFCVEFNNSRLLCRKILFVIFFYNLYLSNK